MVTGEKLYQNPNLFFLTFFIFAFCFYIRGNCFKVQNMREVLARATKNL